MTKTTAKIEPKATKVETQAVEKHTPTDAEKQAQAEARLQSRFNIGPTDLAQIRAAGDEREGIAAHLVNNTHVDPKEARKQVDEYFKQA
jgi:hypothetical protein